MLIKKHVLFLSWVDYVNKFDCSSHQIIKNCILINPEPAEFLKWNNPHSIFGTAHYHF